MVNNSYLNSPQQDNQGKLSADQSTEMQANILSAFNTPAGEGVLSNKISTPLPAPPEYLVRTIQKQNSSLNTFRATVLAQQLISGELPAKQPILGPVPLIMEFNKDIGELSFREPLPDEWDYESALRSPFSITPQYGASQSSEGEEKETNTGEEKSISGATQSKDDSGITVKSITTGADKFIVDDKGIQKIMTREQIAARGGTVPEETNRQDIVRQIEITQGHVEAEAKAKEFDNRDRAKILAEQIGTVPEEAYKLIVEYQKNPDKFKVISTESAFKAGKGDQLIALEDKVKLAEAAGVRYDPTPDWMDMHVQVGRNVQQKTPEYISKADAEKIKAENPNLWDVMLKQGIGAYTTTIENIVAREEAEEKEYRRKTAELEESIKRDTPEFYKIYKDKGYDAYKKAIDDYNLDVDKQNAQYLYDLSVFEASLKDQPEELQRAYKEGGYAAFWAAYDNYMADYNKALKEVEPYTGPGVKLGSKSEPSAIASGQVTEKKQPTTLSDNEIDIARYLQDKKDPQYLKTLGISDTDIKAARDYNVATHSRTDFVKDYFAERGWDTAMPFKMGEDVPQSKIDEWDNHLKEANNAYYQIVPEGRPSAIAKEMALGMIPVVGTVRYYQKAKEGGISESEARGLAVSAVFDVITVVPVLGQLSAAARGTYLAGEAGRFLTPAIRARELGRAAGSIAIAEVKAPFVAIAHPIETLKAGLSPIETILRNEIKIGGKTLITAKEPLSALESKWNTMRIPVSAVGNEKEATALRDAVTSSMIRGESTEATLAGTKVKLNPAAINKLGEPVAISATPDIRPFMDGAIVGKGKPVLLEDGKTVIMGEGRDLYVAPTYHSRFSEATSGGMIPKDSIPGGLIIRDKKILDQIVKSGNPPYGGAMEIEGRIPAGKNIELPKPSQIIISRTSYGKKLTFAVIGKPFTAAELVEMKLIGSLDTVTQIFKAPVKVSQSGKAGAKAYEELSELANEHRALMTEANTLRQTVNTAKLKIVNTRLETVNRRIEERYPVAMNLITERYRLPINTVMLSQGPGVIERYNQAVGNTTGREVVLRDERTQGKERQTPEPTRPRVIVKTSGRSPPKLTEPRKTPEAPKHRLAPELTKTRLPVKLPDRRIPRRIPPIPPSNRIPPQPPEKRVPPTPPRKGVPPPPKRVPPHPPTPGKPPIPPKPPIGRKGKGATPKDWTPEETKSAIAWRDGFAVHAIKSPYRRGIDEKSFNIDHLPEGLIVMKNYKGAGSQERSAKVIGRFPNRLTVDVGNQDVVITRMKSGKVKLQHFRDTRQNAGMTTIKRGRMISKKRGRVFHTRASGGEILSRRPFRGY